MTDLRIGYVPLVDCAPLIVAKEFRFAEAEGLAIGLEPLQSWSNTRDRLAVGSIDAAHMLAPLAIAMSLGLSGLKIDIAAPLMLNLGGQVICLSERLLGQHAARVPPTEPGKSVKHLVENVGRPLRIAVPYFFSTHHYLLRYWLAGIGLDPDRDIKIDVVPPAFMLDAFRAEHIDGCVVGEPWGSACVDAGLAQIVMSGQRIWGASPEKVLGFRRSYLDERPERASALLRAIINAAKWCDAPKNHALLAEILARPQYLNNSAEVIERALSGRFTVSPSGNQLYESGFLRFHSGAAFFPWRSQARWLHAQMVRWGHSVREDSDRAAEVFDPSFLRQALTRTDVDLPGANEKLEGSLGDPTGVASTRGTLMLPPDRFFDDVVFDPALYRPAI